MSRWSKDWDDREEKDKERENRMGQPRASIFNLKLLVFVGIVLLLVTFIIAFSTAPIYADGDCHDNTVHITLLCYIIMIHEQNQQIIEKLDWNNCVLLAKETQGYNAPFVTGWSEQLPSDLMDECGDMP